MNDLSLNFKENFLYHIWDGEHLRRDRLETTDGRKVEILFRGRWNMDAGPDFIGAILKIDGELKKGDIEIHVNNQDWFLHKHQLDKHYNHVILHAVFFYHRKAKSCQTEAGTVLPTLILSKYLDESVSRLRSRVDTTKNKKTWPEICSLSDKTESHKAKILDHWGLERLRLKKERFLEERDYFQFNDLLYQGLCEALGYAKNREPFLRLALMIPLSVVWQLSGENGSKWDEKLLKLQGVFFGASGILSQAEEEIRILPTEIVQFVQRLKFYWLRFQSEYQSGEMQFIDWKFFRLRPQNFPTVRIAGLCKFLLTHHQSGLLEPVLSVFRDLREQPARIFPALQHHFIVESYGFWQNHYQLQVQNSMLVQRNSRLIGPGKAKEIIVNVVLPIVWAYAEEADDFELHNLVKTVYLTTPKLDTNQITRKMSEQLKINRESDTFGKLTSCKQQGMIHLAKSFCPKWYCQECSKIETEAG